MKKILKKTGIAFMVAVAGFTTASSWTVIYAGWVPVAGIDYPFDPANYYTQTTVSIPDSAPSPFALRDLADNGGQVYDYTRHIKSQLFGEKFQNLLARVTDKLGINIFKYDPLGSSGGAILHNSLQELVNNNKAHSVQIEESPAVFNAQFHDGAAGSTVDNKSAARFLSNSYESIAVSTKERMNDNESLYRALNEALQTSTNAAGSIQINQAGNQIDAIENMAITNLTEVMGNMTQLKNLYQQRRTADMNGVDQQISNGSFHFYSPETDAQDKAMIENYEKITGQKRYESKGMVDFN